LEDRFRKSDRLFGFYEKDERRFGGISGWFLRL
jgi:hypothetical protein